MNRPLGLAAVATAAALALPVPFASAHPSVYTTSAKQYENGTLSDFTRYVVINHGRTVVLTESNGLAAPLGVVAFNNLPSGAYRDGLDTQLMLVNGDSGAQAHATCNGNAAQLENPAAVTSWQGGLAPRADPGAAVLQLRALPAPPRPASMIGPSSGRRRSSPPASTSPTLPRRPAPKAACEAEQVGRYVRADTLTTTSAALSLGADAPLEREIDALKATGARRRADRRPDGR